MELKKQGFFYLGLSFFLWLTLYIIQFLFSKHIFAGLLYSFLKSFGYVILFFVILFFFFSVYKFSFAYPDKRSKIPLLLSLVGVPLFLIIAFFINPPEGDMAGLGWIIFFVFIIPITTLVFLGISFFISKVAFKIDTQREIENKKSIFLRPIIISSVLLISFSALIYFEEQALPWHNDSLPEIIINALTGFSNKIPFVAVYIPIIAIMIFVWVYHAARK